MEISSRRQVAISLKVKELLEFERERESELKLEEFLYSRNILIDTNCHMESKRKVLKVFLIVVYLRRNIFPSLFSNISH